MWFGRDGKNNVLVMELVGRTVESLYVYCQQRFSLKTVLLLADQLIVRMEAMHRKGERHRRLRSTHATLRHSLAKLGHVSIPHDRALCSHLRLPGPLPHTRLLSRARYLPHTPSLDTPSAQAGKR